MAIIIDGKAVELPGLTTVSYLEDPRLRLSPEDRRRRAVGASVRGIVLHTTKGIPGGEDMRPQAFRPGLGPRVEAGLRCARYWSTGRKPDGSPLIGGAHLVVDFDGTVSCCADILLEAAQHAGVVNGFTVGIEIYQGSDAEMYVGQLAKVVLLVDGLTRLLGIQRQIPDRYRGPLRRFSIWGDGRDVVGVYGHRDVSGTRGRGDPGSKIFQWLAAAGYEDYDLDRRQDIAAWAPRQAKFGIIPTDGIAGPATTRALAAAGIPHGIWVRRPGDDPAPPAPLVA